MVVVKRVTVNGCQVRALPRSIDFRNKNMTGVRCETNRGEVSLRLRDFDGVPLQPSLDPGAFSQTFVCGPVLERAEKVISSVPEIRSRLFPMPSANIDFANLPFGLNASDVMFVSQIKRGDDWRSVPINRSLFPFQGLSLSPAAQVIHYGQTGFEGGKAYRSSKGRIVSFRLEENAKRHARTSARIALTPIPADYYLEAIKATVLANEQLLAPPGLGAALYLRPTHFGSGPQLGVAPAPVETFMVFVSPVGPYFKGGFTGKPMLVEDLYRRSAPGLMGDVKVGGNYAGSLLPGTTAKANDFAEVIYLDAMTGKNVEEVGAANAFFVVNGVLYTPKLTGTILPGITRDSIITLARDMGIKVVDDRPLPLKFALKADEAFCTGTAAVVTPVGSITKGGKKTTFNNGEAGPLTRTLYETLVGIQEERISDPYGWVYFIG
ncbi:MAG: branched-chain amino acid aminotransferase [Candidatus Margulisbacteria bacterium]|nr:branched-chain amino acid aminotransferase [Candidatus Margulisiibacteriota bacterium]